jgi:hypothetical protein
LRLHRIPVLDAAEEFFLSLLPECEERPESAGAPLTAPPPSGPVPNPRPAGFWQEVLNLAADHRLAGYLYSRYRDDPCLRDCPTGVRKGFRELYAQTALRNQLFRRELGRILAAFARGGIDPLLLKGSALNLTVYADPGARAHADIDLLLAPPEIEKATEIIRSLGYRLDVGQETEQFYRDHHFHLIFRHHARTWCCVELHWDLAVPLMDTSISAATMRERSATCGLDGQTVRIAATEDLLLHLCLHASLSGFGLLSQIGDIHAVLANAGGAIDPDPFWRRARLYRLATPTVLGLELTRLFGPQPQCERLLDAAPALRHGSCARALLRRETVVRRRLLESTAGVHALALWRRDREGDRWRYLARLIRPTPAELALNGHGAQRRFPYGRRRLRPAGLSLAFRCWLYTALALVGWEVAPTIRTRRAWKTREATPT